MKTPGFTNLTLIIGALLLVLVTGIFMSAKAFEAQVSSRIWVIHTYKVLNSIQNLVSDLKSAETSQRSYLLLGDESAAQSCSQLHQKVNAETQALKELVSDNSPQVRRVVQFEESVKQLFTVIDKSIELRRSKGLSTAISGLQTDTIDGDGNSSIEKIAAEMSKIENLLLDRRLANLTNNTAITYRYITSVYGMFIVALLIIIWLYSASRDRAERNLLLQHSISKMLNESQDLADVIQKIEKLIGEQGNWSVASTWLLHEKEHQLRCFDIWSIPSLSDSKFVEVTKAKRFQKGEGLPGRVWDAKEGKSIPLLTSDKNFQRGPVAAEAGLKSGFAFPITSDKKFLGAIEVFSAKARTLDKHSVAILESVGREIGRLLDRQENIRRFQATFNSTFGFIGFLDTKGNILDINETALKFAGITLQDVIGKPFWEAPWWSHSKEQQSMVRNAIERGASGEFVRFEATHPDPDGKPAYVDFSLTPVKDEDGEVVYLLPEGRNITEKKEAEIIFRAVFDQTFSFIGLCNVDGTIIDTNQSALDFIGKKMEDLLGMPFWDAPWWQHDAQLRLEVKEYTERAAAGEFVRFETRNPSLTGELFDFDVSIKPVFDETGKVIFLIPEGRNITETKEAERRVSEFYSTVSHELRTPLTSIRGSLGLMEGGLTGALPEKSLKMVKIARAESDRLIRLINDILDLQKIEAGMIELKRTNVETKKLVERTLESIKGMADTLNVRLISKIETDGPVFCDEDRITQVLTNLVSNALKFSPAGEKVVVALEPGSGNTFRFSVIDRGPGIPEDQAHKLFARFQQLDQSDSRPKGGTGLGLAITKGIVEEHKGKIGVDSEVGKGSTFWFELPASFVPTRIESGWEDDVPPGHIHPALIIEDDNGIAEVLKEHLKQDGFEVVRASTLNDARKLLQKCNPLVILLDLSLPDGDGLDFLKTLSDDENRRHIPVVIVTGRDGNGTVQCSHPALIDWVEKPFNEKKLHEAFDAARKKVGPARVLLVEDDLAAREILLQQLSALGVNCLEAKDGAEAIKVFRDSNPDLIILDLSIPAPDGYAVVDIISKEANGHKPLIVYTASDLNNEQKKLLKLGLTAHLTKSVNSVDQVIGTVKDFLDGLVPPPKV